eukprot:s1592_g3.t1
MAAMPAMEFQSEPINQLESYVKKVKDHAHFLEDKLTLLKTAVAQEKPEDLSNVLSQESLDNARKFQGLKPATCPPGSDRLEDLKSEAERGQERCEQTAAAAKDTLADLGTKAKEIDAAALALTMENHRSSELAKMEDVAGKVAEVSGDYHQVRSVDEVLEAEGISTSLSKTSKMEKYEKVKSQRETEYLDTLVKVFGGPVALPMNFDQIIAVQDETQAELSQIGEKAEQGRVEVQNIHENLATHLDSVQKQLVTCRKLRRNSLEKVQTICAKAEEDLDAWRKVSIELVDEVSLVEELCMRQTNLSWAEHSVTDKIGEAARVSPATDAALAACSMKATERTEEIAKATKETATGLKEKAMKPLTLALEVAEANVHGLSRAVDQREKQILTTKKELETSEDDLKQKMEDFNRGACSQIQIAEAKSEVTGREKSLKQQEEELRKVQDKKNKAQHRSDSCFTSLSSVGCPANKTEISQHGKEQAETAGTFDIFLPQVSLETPTPPGPESTALMQMPFVKELVAKIVKEEVSKEVKIQRCSLRNLFWLGGDGARKGGRCQFISSCP